MIRDEQTDSIWAHTDGVAVSGPLKGTVLEPFPIYYSVWEDWVHMHPESEVLLWPADSAHRDGRHGHGARDYLGRPGVRAGRGFGIKPGKLDERLKENELVLGVSHPAGDLAVPLRDLHKSRGVVNEFLGDEAIVVWSPFLDSPIGGGFIRRLEGVGVLSFSVEHGRLIDQETQSLWNVEGTAIEGPLLGKSLCPLDWVLVKWHGWSGYHPGSGIFRAGHLLAETDIPEGVFRECMAALRREGFSTHLDGMVLKSHLPNLAVRGLRFKVAEDPFILYEYQDVLGAEEYCYAHRHNKRIGRYVLQSDPEIRFLDTAQLEPLPEGEIAWSGWLDSDHLIQVIEKVFTGTDSWERTAEKGLAVVLDRLDELGYPVEIVEQLECRRMPPEAVNGFELLVAGEPFLAYRFANPATAEEFSAAHGHAICAGNVVLRSDPPVQYKSMVLKSVTLSDEEIDWSELLGDHAFLKALKQAVS